MLSTLHYDYFCHSTKYLNMNGPRKCSSLKKVTFADEKGFSLTSVKNLNNFDFSEFQRIMHSSTEIKEYKKLVEDYSEKNVCDYKWRLQFQDPSINLYNVEQKILKNNVALESIKASENDKGISQISGTVKVKKLSSEKSVLIRVSFDNWKSYEDHRTVFCYSTKYCYCHSEEKNDIFWFQINLPIINQMREDIVTEFAIVLRCKSAEFWDNNENKNYSVTLVKCS
uniref:PPP1R-1 n=1 Tax=Dendrocoelum lacteum TaxID=27895 RepID=T1D125_9PLAT